MEPKERIWRQRRLSAQSFLFPAFLIRLNPRNPRLGSIAQLDVPVSKIDKVPPTLVLRGGERDMQEWPPLRPLRFANETHLRFLRQTIAFARVTRNARANHVFPSRRSAAVARHYVIEIQIVTIEGIAAILAHVLVALENVVAGKFHFLFRQPIEKEQHDHARHADLP